MSPNSVISLISEINQRAKKMIIDELAQNGIKGIVTSHGDILSRLYTLGPLSQKEISDYIRREKNTTTVLLNKLEENGYITRTPCPEDKRKTIIKLSKKGQNLKPVFDGISEKLISSAYRGFTPDEKTELMYLLEKIKDNFNPL